MDRAYRDRLSHPLLQERELKVLQKDGFFRNRRDESFRQTQPIAPTPAPASAANTAPSSTEPEKSAERKESKLVVGPDIKLKGVEISDCDTLVVQGRVE